MLKLSVHIALLTACTAAFQESINLFEVGSTEKYVPSFPYPVPTSVRLEMSLVKTWKHTGRSVPMRWSSVSITMWDVMRD